MTTHPLPPAAPDPSLPLATTMGPAFLASARSLTLSQLSTLLRISQHITPLDDSHGRLHLLWAGPVRPGSAIPLVHRWNGHKNVSAHRVLWEVLYGSPPVGNPRRLHECAYDTCVAPQCFTTATPVEPGTLPEIMTRGRRVDVNGEPVADYKVAADVYLHDRYYWRGDTFIDIACSFTGDERDVHKIPCCPNLHPITRWMDDWHEHIGQQFRCWACTRLMRFVKDVRGWQPRAGFRPLSAQSINRERELREWMDSIPHVPEDHSEPDD